MLPMKHFTLDEVSPSEITLSIIRQYAHNCTTCRYPSRRERIYLN